MKSELHETFSGCQDWSPEFISNVCSHGCACMHAQHMQNLRVMKQIKVAQEGPMYTHKNFNTFKCCWDWSDGARSLRARSASNSSNLKNM